MMIAGRRGIGKYVAQGSNDIMAQGKWALTKVWQNGAGWVRYNVDGEKVKSGLGRVLYLIRASYGWKYLISKRLYLIIKIYYPLKCESRKSLGDVVYCTPNIQSTQRTCQDCGTEDAMRCILKSYQVGEVSKYSLRRARGSDSVSIRDAYVSEVSESFTEARNVSIWGVRS